MAGIELGRRVSAAASQAGEQIKTIRSSADAMALCRVEFSRLADDAAQEEFHIVSLNTNRQPTQTNLGSCLSAV
jgi:DNA repair protein RadC